MDDDDDDIDEKTNSMKWDSIQPKRDAFQWAWPDYLLDYAKNNSLEVRGHTFLWHSQLPQWVQSITDKAGWFFYATVHTYNTPSLSLSLCLSLKPNTSPSKPAKKKTLTPTHPKNQTSKPSSKNK